MRVLVGITGGIAAYKAAEVIRELTELGHEVKVVPTQNALRFIGAATLEALSHNQVHSELYSDVADVKHIELARWAEVLLVAPATASFLARTASGVADDLLGNIVLATTAPIIVAPAMHTEMWANNATVANVLTLRARGIIVVEPGIGRLTGNDSGVGRLPEPSVIVSIVQAVATPKDLSGKKVLVVAGGTREPIDPVRYIGNRSSGKQGIALVEVALTRGATVTLVAANFEYTNRDVQTFSVSSAQDLKETLDSLSDEFDYVIMPAAVSDFRVENISHEKIKRVGDERLSIVLLPNQDLISELSHRLSTSTKIVGFAAETETGEKLVENARAKLTAKNLFMIVANDVSEGKAFDAEENSVVLITHHTSHQVSASKAEIANQIYSLLLKGH
jgi:phosphopantothenoylcysteine decarboxylase/phosphopantothenate--cysteine ligase